MIKGIHYKNKNKAGIMPNPNGWVEITEVSGFKKSSELPPEYVGGSVAIFYPENKTDTIRVIDKNYSGIEGLRFATVSIGDYVDPHFFKELKIIEEKARIALANALFRNKKKRNLTDDQKDAIIYLNTFNGITPKELDIHRKTLGTRKQIGNKLYPSSYNILEQLVSKGLVVKTNKKRDSSIVYKLTLAGRAIKERKFVIWS